MTETPTDENDRALLSPEGEAAFEELNRILDILDGAGLTITHFVDKIACSRNEFARLWNNKPEMLVWRLAGNPLVDDEANGIRSIFKDNHWYVWYTNGFESPTHPLRMKIAELLRSNGLQAGQITDINS